MKRCLIFGAAGELPDNIKVNKDDFVIAADAGYKYTSALGIKPDITVGDFDSLGKVPENENIVKHPKIKDDTDTMLAVKLALEKGIKSFVLYGCLGGRRLDQTLASIQTVSYITERGGKAFLYSAESCVTAIKNGSLTFKKSAGGMVSVFALSGKVSGVYLENLKYPLTDYVITPDFPLGVSNEFTGESAVITAKNGILTVMWNGSPEDILSEENYAE